jgi:hypothetical protein
MLETKTLQSRFPSDSPALGLSHFEIGRSNLGSADAYSIKVSEFAKFSGISALNTAGGVMRVVTPTDVPCAHSTGTGLTANAQESGKLDPKDPGGVELAIPADSGKLDPKDPGGVELAIPADSGKLDPKDPGGVELTWVDQAVVDRLGRTHDAPRSSRSF